MRSTYLCDALCSPQVENAAQWFMMTKSEDSVTAVESIEADKEPAGAMRVASQHSNAPSSPHKHGGSHGGGGAHSCAEHKVLMLQAMNSRAASITDVVRHCP